MSRHNIKHLEDLKPLEALEALTCLSSNTGIKSITEKLDGAFFEFGIDENGLFYTSSNGKIAHEAEDYSGAYFYEHFKRYHRELEKCDIIHLLSNSIMTYYIKNVDPVCNIENYEKDYLPTRLKDKKIQLLCEMIPKFNYNVIDYSKKEIGNGILCIFKILVNKIDITKYVQMNFLTHDLTHYSTIQISNIPFLSLSNSINFPLKNLEKLKKIIEKYREIIEKNSRKKEFRKTLINIQKINKIICSRFKREIIANFPKSNYGEKIEGMVIELESGLTFKIVDRETFNKEKNERWEYINKLDKLEKDFLSSNDNLNTLTVYKEDIDQLEMEYLFISKQFKENKKVQDTLKCFEWHRSKVVVALQMLNKGIKEEEILNLWKGKML